MIVLSQNSTLATDALAFEIQQLTNESGEIVGFSIAAFCFGTFFTVAEYRSLDEAKVMFMDIMKAWSGGKEFYDLRVREKAVFKL